MRLLEGIPTYGRATRVELTTPTGAAILKLVDATDPPLRIFLGSSGLPMTRAEYARRIETWEKWNDVSMEAQGDLAAKS